MGFCRFFGSAAVVFFNQRWDILVLKKTIPCGYNTKQIVAEQ